MTDGHVLIKLLTLCYDEIEISNGTANKVTFGCFLTFF